MKKIFLFIICFSIILGNCSIVFSQENVSDNVSENDNNIETVSESDSDPCKNIVSNNVKEVMENTVMLRPGSSNAFAYGFQYDLYEYGENAEVRTEGTEVYVKTGFLKEVFPDKSIGNDEEAGIYAFAQNNGLQATEYNGTIYVYNTEYSLPAQISNNINKFFGIYVAPDAKGSGLPENPVGSLSVAKSIVSELKKSIGLPNGGISVYFREGNYPITSTVNFFEDDSGLEGSPIVYRAYKDEKVSFNGGVSIKGSEFEPVTDVQVLKKLSDPENVVCIDLSKKLEGFNDSFKTQDPANWSVFYNDETVNVARWPDKDYTLTGEVLDDGGSVRGVGFTFVIGDTRIKNWANEADPRIFGYFGFDWAGERRGIASVDTQKLSITTDDFAEYGVASGKRYYVYNMLCELDAPGEFYFDKSSNYLYFYPVEGDPNNSDFLNNEVQFSLLSQEMVIMNGASYVEFENIIFENSLALGMNVNENSTNIKIQGCTFKNIANGIDLYGFNNLINGCDFYNISVRPVSAYGGDRVTLTHSGNVISNNKFWNFNIVSRTNTAAIMVKGCGDIITHNEIIDSPHTSMAIGGNDNIIEYNEFYNNLVDQAQDAGTVYGGRNLSEQGNILRYNYFHDTACDSIGVIYFDDGMSGNYVDSNVFENTGTGVFVHGGVCTEITDNLFMGGTGTGTGFSSASYSWKISSATSMTANTLLWNLIQFPYTSEPWQRYNNVFKYLESDEDPITMYDSVVTGNICVGKEVISAPEKDLAFMTVDNNTIVSAEDAETFEIPQKFKEIMDNAGVYVDEYRTSLDEMHNFNLLRPYNKETDVEASEVFFEWDKVLDAHSYQFTLATDKDFKNIISNKIVDGNYVTISKLNYFNTRYYWKVKALANDTNSVSGSNELACNQDYYTFTTKAFEVVSKESLYDRIEICENQIPGIVEGSEPGEYKEGTVDAMTELVEKYKVSAASETLSQKEVDTMTSELAEQFERLTYRRNPEYFDMASMATSGNLWSFTPNQVTFTAEGINFINLGASTMGTLERIGTHEMYKFDALMDGLESAWYAFGMRAQNSATAVAWSGNPQYMFLIKKDTIEFQKWGDENLLIEYPNEYIKNGEWCKIEMSALDREDGAVVVTLKVNGNTVVEYEDLDNPITKPGFFEIYNTAADCSIKIKPVEE